MRADSRKFFAYPCLVLLAFAVLMSACRNEAGKEGGWKFIGHILDENDAKVSVYIDEGNIETDGQVRKFWVRYMAYDLKADPPAEYLRQEGYWKVDCYDRKLTRLAEEYYSPDGTMLGSTQEPRIEEYSSKDTIGGRMASAACRYAGE